MVKSKKSVLVCKSKCVVSGLQAVYKNNKFFYADDGKKGFLTRCDIPKLACELHEGLSLSGPVKLDEINYVPPQTAMITYLDGYFGRPLIPNNIYVLSSLSRKERKELHNYMLELERNSLTP